MSEQPLESLLILQSNEAVSGRQRHAALSRLYGFLKPQLAMYLQKQFSGTNIEGYVDDIVNFVAMRCTEPDRFRGTSNAEAWAWIRTVAFNKAQDLLQLRKKKGIHLIPIGDSDDSDDAVRTHSARNLRDTDISAPESRIDLYSSLNGTIERALSSIPERVHGGSKVSPRERAMLYLRCTAGEETVEEQVERLFPRTGAETGGRREPQDRALLYKLHERGRDDLCAAIKELIHDDVYGEELRCLLESILCTTRKKDKSHG